MREFNHPETQNPNGGRDLGQITQNPTEDIRAKAHRDHIDAQQRQVIAATQAREYERAGLPLLAESYWMECKALGEIIFQTLKILEATDPRKTH